MHRKIALSATFCCSNVSSNISNTPNKFQKNHTLERIANVILCNALQFFAILLQMQFFAIETKNPLKSHFCKNCKIVWKNCKIALLKEFKSQSWKNCKIVCKIVYMWNVTQSFRTTCPSTLVLWQKKILCSNSQI